MTVRELIAILELHEPDAKVNVTWESVCRGLASAHIYGGNNGVVYIDGGACRYRANLTGMPYDLNFMIDRHCHHCGQWQDIYVLNGTMNRIEMDAVILDRCLCGANVPCEDLLDDNEDFVDDEEEL